MYLTKKKKKKSIGKYNKIEKKKKSFFYFLLLLFQGIRVQVRSVYIEGRSQPSKGLCFFAYRIRITNNSDRPVQLLRRHWIITDANGKVENVWLVFFFFFYGSFDE
jgi:hypothetical protein